MNTAGWIDPGASAGNDTTLWHQAQIAAGAQVGAECTLGKGAYVGGGSQVGDRVKIGNYASIFGAHIADEAMICPAALLLEDSAPRSTTATGAPKKQSDYTHRPVRIGVGATIGAAAVIAPGVMVGAHAMVAIGAIVTHNVAAHALVAGNPARPCGWACVCGATLDADLRCQCGRHYLLDGQILIRANKTGGAL